MIVRRLLVLIAALFFAAPASAEWWEARTDHFIIYSKSSAQDAKDFAGFAATKLDMPFLVLTGEKASGTTLIEQTKLVATNVKGIIVKGSGHWLMEEAPDQVIPELVSFIRGGAKK